MTSKTFFNALLEAADILQKETDKNQITGNGNGDRNSSTTQDGQNVWQMEFEAFQADEPAKSKRANLRERFEKLREVLPNLSSGSKVSSVRILKEATDVIEELKTKELYYVNEKSILQHRKTSLQTKLTMLLNGEEPPESDELYICLESPSSDRTSPVTDSVVTTTSDENYAGTGGTNDGVKTVDVGVNTDFPDDITIDEDVSKITVLKRVSTDNAVDVVD